MIGNSHEDLAKAFAESVNMTMEKPSAMDSIAGKQQKYPKGFGRLRVLAERRARYCRALIWLAFRFDLARLDQEAREQSTRDQLATTGGLDPAQFPKPSEIAYLKFSEL